MSSRSPYTKRGVPSKSGTVKPKSMVGDRPGETVFLSAPRPASSQSVRGGSADEAIDAAAKTPGEDVS
jgi:hypothetical protein